MSVSLVQLISIAADKKILDPSVLHSVRRWISIRNELVHTMRTIDEYGATGVVDGVLEVIEKVRNRSKSSDTTEDHAPKKSRSTKKHQKGDSNI